MSNKVIILCTFVVAVLFIGICTITPYAKAASESDWQAAARVLGYKPGELIVRFAPKANARERTRAEKNTILASINGGTIKRSYKLVPGLTLIKLPVNATVANSLGPFRASAGILYAYPNHYGKVISAIPDDTYFNKLWGMHNTGQSGGTEDADIYAHEAWEILTDADDVIVAVIDTGIDYDHPDLSTNMWINEAEYSEDPNAPSDLNGDGYPGIAGIDDDGDGLIDEDSQNNSRYLEDGTTPNPDYNNDLIGDDDENGYVDDIYGYDFCNNDGDPDDDNGHGTHCAGITGAVGNNDEGVTGVCWNARIMALKWMDTGGYGSLYDAIDCIGYAVEMGAKVLSNSWRQPGESEHQHYPPMENAIEAAHQAGVLFIASAGNKGSDTDTYLHYPSGYTSDNVISVLATDHDDERSDYAPYWASNYGAKTVDLGAPGSYIHSCLPTDLSQDGYGDKSGTSMAAPHVAGACALVWSRNLALSHLKVKDIILDTVDKLDSLDEKCVSGGRLNLYNAVLKAGNISLSVDDRVYGGDCVSAGDYIDYKISYSNPTYDPNDPCYVGDVNDVIIVDYLPDEVDFVPTESDTGEYDSNGHTYRWDIGLLAAGEVGYRFLKVQVNESAYPMDEIINRVKLTNDTTYPQEATEETEICCYGGGVIYVDASVEVTEPNGANWERAYKHLKDALAVASICDEIWVAEGVYRQAKEPNLVNFVGVYGGFDGSESRRYERDWWANKTIICADPNDDDDVSKDFGDPDRCNVENADYAIRANPSVEWAVLDGFTIRRGKIGGIYCNESSVLIEHNKIIDSGIGIYCDNTETAIIRNNWIYGNEMGIYMDNPKSAGIIENNTIVYNKTVGVLVESGTKPLISSCIFWGCSEPNDLDGCYATYSCIEYPKHFWDNSNPSNPIDLGIGLGNISGDPNNPLFVGTDYHLDPNSYHLELNSPCIDAGNPNYVYTGNERDIDKHFRLLYGRVDMGADEYCDECDTSDADFTGDDIVNMLDYDEFAAAWLRDSSDPNWGDKYFEYDLLGDGDAVDVNDLCVFAEDWLWMGCEAMKKMPIKESMAMEMYYEMSQMSGFMQAGVLSSAELEPEPLSIKEQIAHAKEVVDWLEKIWEDDEEVSKTIDEDDWDEFMKKIYEWLNELETSPNI